MFEDNFKKILLILEVFQNDYQTKRMDIRLVNEFWKEFEMVDGTVKFFSVEEKFFWIEFAEIELIWTFEEGTM